jgi:hypothetical protein
MNDLRKLAVRILPLATVLTVVMAIMPCSAANAAGYIFLFINNTGLS